MRFWKNHPEKLGLLIISDHKNSCLKGEPHQGRNWEFFIDLLTNHFLPVFYLSFIQIHVYIGRFHVLIGFKIFISSCQLLQRFQFQLSNNLIISFYNKNSILYVPSIDDTFDSRQLQYRYNSQFFRTCFFLKSKNTKMLSGTRCTCLNV